MSTPASPAGGGRASGSASAIVAGGVSGYHLLKIDGYSRTKGAPNGDHIQSCPFTAGGYQWHIKYYPNGDHIESADYISLYLYLDDTAAQAVKAHFKISLLDQVGEPVSSHTKTSSLHSFGTTQRSWGYTTFIKREVLERSGHLKDDCFTVRCDITVLKEIRTKKTNAATPFVLVPPSDLHQHLGGLLLSQKGADVTFKVGRQTFSAHRCVLGARSPVFEAELFGRMKESTTTSCIRIVDTEPRVFSALLHYIYTDTVPEMNDQEVVMAQHLLVAADRYDMPRLKLIC